MNVITLPNGIAKPEHAAIFAPRVGPLDTGKEQFWLLHPAQNEPLTRVNARGEYVRRFEKTTSNKPSLIVIDDIIDQTRWAGLIEDCKILNVDPHILFVGRPLKLAVEPFTYTHMAFSRYAKERTGQLLYAIHVGGTFDKHQPLDDLVQQAQEWF